MKLRRSPQTLEVLTQLLSASTEWMYGYEISRKTGLQSGTLYPILMRLAERGLLETRWENVEPGKPPRHMYRLTANGLQFAKELLPRRASAIRAEAILGGAKS